ncbi:MAG: hypothetical protein SVJ22_06690 [Halobacteriota archaeon]|nr:hypothetical protein [Halobacteriota archaeon]
MGKENRNVLIGESIIQSSVWDQCHFSYLMGSFFYKNALLKAYGEVKRGRPEEPKRDQYKLAGDIKSDFQAG